MAKFLNTTGINYHLEEMIINASERLILISPYLQFSDRIKELLEDKNRLKIDVRIVYGKSKLLPEETDWLTGLDFIRTSFCKNLHAKCYLNEHHCIITSLNLYEFSQINNNEMGILIDRNKDEQIYNDAYEEVQRIIRISNDRMSDDIKASTDTSLSHKSDVSNRANNTNNPKRFEKLAVNKLAEKLGMKTAELNERLEQLGYIEIKEKTTFLTEKGKQVGGELRKSQYGYFTVWSVDLDIAEHQSSNSGESFADKLLKLFKF